MGPADIPNSPRNPAEPSRKAAPNHLNLSGPVTCASPTVELLFYLRVRFFNLLVLKGTYRLSLLDVLLDLYLFFVQGS